MEAWRSTVFPEPFEAPPLPVSYVQPQWARDGGKWSPHYPVSPASYNLELLATSDIGSDSHLPCWPKGWLGGSCLLKACLGAHRQRVKRAGAGDMAAFPFLPTTVSRWNCSLLMGLLVSPRFLALDAGNTAWRVLSNKIMHFAQFLGLE